MQITLRNNGCMKMSKPKETPANQNQFNILKSRLREPTLLKIHVEPDAPAESAVYKLR